MASSEDDDFQRFMPSSFGGRTTETDIEAQVERTRRKAYQPKKVSDTKSTPSDKSDDSDDDSDEEDDDEYPVSHELVFKTHDRPITSITIDPAGSRMITGSTDCTIKFYDFASMTPNTLRAFKSVDPTETKQSQTAESHPVHVAKFNPNSPARVLVISATSQAKIMSRDGETITEFSKGDMYLRDMNGTKGHVSEITSGTWHPTNRDLCVTAGTDSTLRIWDANKSMKQRDVIVHKSKVAGNAGKSRITAVAWGSQVEGTNSLLVSAALDGSLSIWPGEGPYHRPAAEVQVAHTSDTWTSGIDISPDGRLVVTRGGDDTIKLWDTRKFKQPVSTVTHPSTSSQYPTSNIQFSPNATSIITGSTTGDLHILNPATLRPDLITPITPNSPLITVHWHPKLNQIITGSASGQTTLLFSPLTSTASRGALSILSRAPKRRHLDDDASLTTALNPEGFAGDDSAQIIAPAAAAQSRSKQSRDTNTSSGNKSSSRDPRRPHLPATTPFSKNAPDQAHIRASIPLSTMREEDPREALLKYADKAEKDPMFTKAWSRTQPKTIYAADEEDEEEVAGGDHKRVKR